MNSALSSSSLPAGQPATGSLLARQSGESSEALAQQPHTDPLKAAGLGMVQVHVHLATRLTPAVLAFLLPAARSLAASGARQILIAQDDRIARKALLELPPGIDFRPLTGRRPALLQSVRMYRALGAVMRDHAVHSLHLHGVHAQLAGSLRMPGNQRERTPSVFFSPHSSRLLMAAPWLTRPILSVLGRLMRPVRLHVIMHHVHDARLLSPRLPSDFTASLVEGSVDPRFFSHPAVGTPAHAGEPLRVLGGSPQYDGLGVQAFAQLAVLLGDAAPGTIRFEWLGPVTPEERALLKAAEVGVRRADPVDERLAALRDATIFVAPVSGRGFPLAIAEAMAAGTPCVARDTLPHRDLLRQGTNGFLYRSPRQMARQVADLLDDPDLRMRIGESARSEAIDRFSRRAFEHSLMNTYLTPIRTGSQLT